MTGGVRSATVTGKLVVPVFPAASCAVQVTTVVPIGKPLFEGGEHMTTGIAPLTRSKAVGRVYPRVVPALVFASKVGSAGTFENAGAVVSTTFTLKLALAVFPVESRPVQPTVVVPSPNVLPDAGVQLTAGAGSTLSTAVTVKVTAAPEGPVASAVLFPGVLRVGAAESVTVIVKVPLAWFPEKSVAVQVTVVVPRAKVLPDAGEHPTVGLGSTLSVAPGLEYVTEAPPGPDAAAVLFDGMPVSPGLTVSTTVTLNVPAGLVLPELSLALQLTVVVPTGNVLPEDGTQLTFGLASTASVAVGFA